jgi:hypothetical protein
MNVESLLQVIETSKNLTPRAFILAVEAELALLVPFNHELPKAIDACGINKEDIPEIEIQSKSTSEAVEKIETLLTKREIAYALAKEMSLTKEMSKSHIDTMEMLLMAIASSKK